MAVKYMDIQEFTDTGYLHEVNRRFFHPLGLALSVRADTDSETGEVVGAWKLGGIFDYRDDPEGVIFDADTLDPEKAARVQAEMEARRPARIAALGYWEQPITPERNEP